MVHLPCSAKIYDTKVNIFKNLIFQVITFCHITLEANSSACVMISAKERYFAFAKRDGIKAPQDATYATEQRHNQSGKESRI